MKIQPFKLAISTYKDLWNLKTDFLKFGIIYLILFAYYLLIDFDVIRDISFPSVIVDAYIAFIWHRRYMLGAQQLSWNMGPASIYNSREKGRLGGLQSQFIIKSFALLLLALIWAMVLFFSFAADLMNSAYYSVNDYVRIVLLLTVFTLPLLMMATAFPATAIGDQNSGFVQSFRRCSNNFIQIPVAYTLMAIPFVLILAGFTFSIMALEGMIDNTVLIVGYNLPLTAMTIIMVITGATLNSKIYMALTDDISDHIKDEDKEDLVA